MYLLDTNIASELMKRTPHTSVQQWYKTIVKSHQPHLSILTLREIERGLMKLRKKNPEKAELLFTQFQALKNVMDPFILPIDTAIALEWGRMTLYYPHHAIDTLLAATAKIHRLTLATRNVKHVEGLGVDTVDPFAYAA